MRADPELERYRLLDAVRELLAALATAAPVLLVLDDLHWADRSTLQMLRHLARAGGPAPVLIVGTYRETEIAGALAAALDDLRREDRSERLTLAGLTEHEARALISARAGHPTSAALSQAVYAETEGNPFFIEAVLAHLAESGAAQPEGGRLGSGYAIARLGVPEGVKEVIRRRLARLGEQCARALQIASVAGRDFELELVAQAAGIEGDELAEMLEEAVAARLVEEIPGTVGKFRFVHGLIRETLYEQLTAARRVRLHRRIGETIERLHAADEESFLPALAHQFCEAAAGGDAGKAIGYARRAGDLAMRLLAYEQAAADYQRALDALATAEEPDERLRLELLLGLGEAHANAGAIDQSRASFMAVAEQARALDDPEALARAALGFGRQYLLFVMRGLFDEELIALIKDALTRLPATPSTLRARLLGRLAWEIMYSPEADRMHPLVEEAIELARATGNDTALAQALNGRSLVLASNEFGPLPERLAVATQALALSERSGDGEQTLCSHENLVRTLVDKGDFTTVDAQIATVGRLATETRIAHYAWYARQWSAMRALMQGRFADAERFAREALAVGQEAIGEAAVQQYGLQVLVAGWLRGDTGGMDSALEGVVKQMPNLTVLRAALASLHAELGREDPARAELERIAEGGIAGIRQGESWLVTAFYIGVLCQQFGDVQRAAAFYPDLLPYARHWVRGAGASAVCLGPLTRTLGQLAATTSNWAEAEDHFEAALGDCARAGARPWLGWTQADYARMLLRRGLSCDGERALALLDEAVATARELGMKPLEQAAVELRADARRRRAPAAATSARR